MCSLKGGRIRPSLFLLYLRRKRKYVSRNQINNKAEIHPDAYVKVEGAGVTKTVYKSQVHIVVRNLVNEAL